MLSLFELFLVVFTLYAVLEYEGGRRFFVVIASLITVLLFERLRARIKEDEEAKKRLLKYTLEGNKKDELDSISWEL